MKKRYALLSLGLASALVLAACSDEKTEEKKEEIEKIEVKSEEPTPKVEEKTKTEEVVEPENVTEVQPVQPAQPVQKEKTPIAEQLVVFDFSKFKTRLVEKDTYLANAKSDGIDATGSQFEMNNYAAKDKELSEAIYRDLVAYITSNLNDPAKLQELTVDLEVFEHNLNMDADAAYKEYEGGSIAPLLYSSTLSEGYQTKINELIVQFQ